MKTHEFLVSKDIFARYHLGLIDKILTTANDDISVRDHVVIVEDDPEAKLTEMKRLHFKIMLVDEDYEQIEKVHIYQYWLIPLKRFSENEANQLRGIWESE